MQPIKYNVIVPRLDRSGPSMLSYDIAERMKNRGYIVKYFYLNEGGSPDNIPFQCDGIKKFSIGDFFKISGVVHSHTLRPDIINAFLSVFARNRTITTIPSYFYRDVIYDYPRWKALLAWVLWRAAVSRIETRVCISDRMKRYYRRLIPGVRFTVAANFRLERDRPVGDVGKLLAVQRWVNEQRALSRFVLVYAAGFRPRKNVLRLIGEVACRSGLALLVIGDGPQKSSVLQEIAKNNSRSQFLYIGMVGSPRAFCRLCDALVLPSFAEGVPNIVLEASSVGTISIVSNIGIHRDLERCGIAVTFNHRSFSDFDDKIEVARRFVSRDQKINIIDAWERRFSGEESMRTYLSVIEGFAV